MRVSNVIGQLGKLGKKRKQWLDLWTETGKLAVDYAHPCCASCGPCEVKADVRRCREGLIQEPGSCRVEGAMQEQQGQVAVLLFSSALPSPPGFCSGSGVKDPWSG